MQWSKKCYMAVWACVRMWCEFDVMLNNFHMMQPFCCIRRKRMWQWFHAAEYILQHWPQYTSNYIPSTEPACHNAQTNDKGTLWHAVEKCLQCCFGSGSEMHQLFTFHVQIMRPWIYPDSFLTFFEIRLFFTFFCHASAALIRRLVGPPRCRLLSSGVEKVPAIRMTEHVLQCRGLMRKADSSPYETYLCMWRAVDAVHWLPNIQFFTLFSIFTRRRLGCCCFGAFSGSPAF